MKKYILEKVMKQTDEQNVEMAEKYLNISEYNLKLAAKSNSEIDILLWKIDLVKRKIEKYKKDSDRFGDMANDCYEAMKLKKEMEK